MRLPIQVQAILYRKTNTEIQYLLLKRISDTGGFWQPITGGIEKGETKTQPAKKRNTRRNRNQKPHQNHKKRPPLRVQRPIQTRKPPTPHKRIRIRCRGFSKRKNHNQPRTHRTQMVQLQRSTKTTKIQRKQRIPKKTKQNSHHAEVNTSSLRLSPPFSHKTKIKTIPVSMTYASHPEPQQPSPYAYLRLNQSRNFIRAQMKNKPSQNK